MSKQALPLANFRNQSPTSIRAQRRGPRQRLGVSFFGPAVSNYLQGSVIVSSPIERRHTRQRIAEKPSRQVARLELGSAITVRQRQGTGPNARREHEVNGLAAASSFIQDFGHCSFPPTAFPSRSPRARQHLGQRVTADCPN
jgi:hypothetical protein